MAYFKPNPLYVIAFGFLKGSLTVEVSSLAGSLEVSDMPSAFSVESFSASNDMRTPFDDVEEVTEEEDSDEEKQGNEDDIEEETSDPLEDSTGGLPSESTQV